MVAPATLGQLRRNRVGLFSWCPRCGWRVVFDSEVMAAVRGDRYPVPWMPDDILCRGCGWTRLEVQPDYPGPGVIVSAVP